MALAPLRLAPTPQRTLGYSFMVRRQAARHWALVMCVAASQKPMQSASDLPPPPGALGADSLGLGDALALTFAEDVPTPAEHDFVDPVMLAKMPRDQRLAIRRFAIEHQKGDRIADHNPFD